MQTCLKHSAPNLRKSSRLKGLGGASCGNYDSKVKIRVGDFNRKKEGRINEKNLPLKGQNPCYRNSLHIFCFLACCSFTIWVLAA